MSQRWMRRCSRQAIRLFLMYGATPQALAFKASRTPVSAKGKRCAPGGQESTKAESSSSVGAQAVADAQ
jgi:hypothetical protein